MKDFYNLLGIDPALKGAELESKLAAIKKEASRRATQASSIVKRLEAQQRLQLLEEATEVLLKASGTKATVPMDRSGGKSSSIIYRHNISIPAPPEGKPIKVNAVANAQKSGRAPPKPVQFERCKAVASLNKTEEQRINDIIRRSRSSDTRVSTVQPRVQAPVQENRGSGLYGRVEAPAFHIAYAGLQRTLWGAVGVLVLLAVLTPVFYGEAAGISRLVYRLLVQYKNLVYAAFLLVNVLCWTAVPGKGAKASAASIAMGISGFLCFFLLLFPLYQTVAGSYGADLFLNTLALCMLWTSILTAAGIGVAVSGHWPTGFFAAVYIAVYEAVRYYLVLKMGIEATFAMQLLAYTLPLLAIYIFDSTLMQVSPFSYKGRILGTGINNYWAFKAALFFAEMPGFAAAFVVITRFILNGMFELVSWEYNTYVRLIELAPIYKAGILVVFLLLVAINLRYKVPPVLGKLYQLVFVSSGAAVHYLALAGLYFYIYRYYRGGLLSMSIYMLMSFCIIVLPAISVSMLMTVKENTAYVLTYLVGFMCMQHVLFTLKGLTQSGYLYFVALTIPFFIAHPVSRIANGKATAGMAGNKKYQEPL